METDRKGTNVGANSGTLLMSLMTNNSDKRKIDRKRQMSSVDCDGDTSLPGN